MAPNSGDIVYARFADDSPATVSRQGFVLLTRELHLTAEFATPIWCEPGEIAELQFVEDHVRWMVEATVQNPSNGDMHPMLRFLLAHEPVRAERRRCVRITTAAAHLQATINERRGCDILNVSAEGMAITTPDRHEANECVSVAMMSAGEVFRGDAHVCHAERRHDGRYRCGLHVEPDQRSLLYGLQRLVMSVQRQQLQRMAARA